MAESSNFCNGKLKSVNCNDSCTHSNTNLKFEFDRLLRNVHSRISTEISLFNFLSTDLRLSLIVHNF